MSPKGQPLANRPSEYFFSLIQREKLSFYEYKDWNFEQVYNLIHNYVNLYNSGRVWSNLEHKTPHSVFTKYGVCV